jgi:hypothetical protein
MGERNGEEVQLGEMPRGCCRFLLCCGLRCWRRNRGFWLCCHRPWLLSLIEKAMYSDRVNRERERKEIIPLYYIIE